MKKGFWVFMLLNLVMTLGAQQSWVRKWDRCYGGTSYDYATSIISTNDGGFLVGGGSQSEISGDKTQSCWDTMYTDYWVIKIDSLGNKIWDKRFGGLLQDNLAVDIQTADGGYILAGESYSNADGDKTESDRGGFDYWVVKIDEFGNKLWDKRFGGYADDLLYAVKQTKDGGYVLGGIAYPSGAGGDKTQSNWGGTDYWIVKIDSVGNKQWDKRYGGLDSEWLQDVLQAGDGGFLLGGESSSDISGDKTQANWSSNGTHPNYWIVKTDSAGNKIWDRRYGGKGWDGLNTMIELAGNCFLLGGSASSDTSGDKTQSSHGGDDYWIIKIDSAGNKIWDKDFGATNEEILTDLLVTSDSGYLLGGYSYSLDADGDKSEANLDNIQAWLIKTDSMGRKEWDKTIRTKGTDVLRNLLQVKDSCYLILCSAGADVGGYKTQPSWSLAADYWVLKICREAFSEVINLTSQPQIFIYPSPFTTDLNINLQKQALTHANFTITNTAGQIVYSRDENNLSSNYTKMLDVSYLPKGIYFVNVTVDGESSCKEVVKQ